MFCLKQFLTFLAIVFTILYFSCSTIVLKKHKYLAGIYKRCQDHCEFITINSNLEFEYQLRGEPFNGEKAKGKLIPIGKNTYLANSDAQPFPLVELETDNPDSCYIKVVDQESKAIAYAKLTITTRDSIYNNKTDDLGIFIYPKAETISINVCFMGTPELTYDISNPDADSFVAKLNFDISMYIINEKWKLSDNQLLLPNENDDYIFEFTLYEED